LQSSENLIVSSGGKKLGGGRLFVLSMFLGYVVYQISMTMPKGFKPKVNKKEKGEKSKNVTAKEDNNNNIDSNAIKVTAATADDFSNKQENKIITDNISPKQEVTVDDIRIDEDAAIITAVTTTPTPEGEVQSETELKVPLQEKEKEVQSETELKVMSSPSSSAYAEATEPPTISSSSSSSSTKPIDEYPENKDKEKEEQMQNITATRVIDEAKDNLRRCIDEARKEVPRYTQAVNDYQEQTIQAVREIADNYIESQKDIINSLQSTWWTPYVENRYGIYSNWLTPRRMAEIYINTVSSFAGNIIAATRLANNIIFANMEAFKASIQQTKDNVKELSRIGVNAARSFEQTSKDDDATTTNSPP